MDVNGIDVKWLGHSTFLLTSPEGKTILVDPWTSGNPSCPEEYHDVSPDLILVTHGHNDHTGDLVSIAQASGAPVVCIYEIATYLGGKGIDAAIGINKGGTALIDSFNVTVTMTDAHHSSSYIDEDGVSHYMGEPAGLVVGFSNGQRFYFAGDTCLFGDMVWIKNLWQPTVAVLPIGDYFTMDPLAAAHACRLLGVAKVVPCHYGTFPVLSGTPEQLAGHLQALGVSAEVVAPPIG